MILVPRQLGVDGVADELGNPVFPGDCLNAVARLASDSNRETVCQVEGVKRRSSHAGRGIVGGCAGQHISDAGY